MGGNMEHFRKLERMYAAAPINEWFAPHLKVGQGEAEVRIPLRPDFHHAAGAAHGTLYFKAMDDATFFAANSIVENFFVLTAKFELELLRPVAVGEMCAKARVTGEDERRIYCEASLFDSEEQLIGRGKGEFARSKMALTPDVHYR
jgi:acyl-coenzyme A thioesterase PaaI-like protein